MTYWLIEFKDGSTGFQVMDDAADYAVAVIDMAGRRITGNLEYTTIDTAPAGPFPEVRDV